MFPNLPEELNELIVSFLDVDDRSTLAAVCWTNRLGRRLATPLLYQHVGVEEHGKSYSTVLLCRTLLENHQLCQYVQEISLHVDYSDWEPSDPTLNPHVSKLLLDLSTRSRLSAHERLSGLLSKGFDMKVYALILIGLCYNAQELHIRGSQYFLTWEKLLDGVIKEAIMPEAEGVTPPSWRGRCTWRARKSSHAKLPP